MIRDWIALMLRLWSNYEGRSDHCLVAALIGDPTRANILTALMDGRALTASELAEAAGVALPTASGHLAKLASAQILTVDKQGRHRYFRLSGPDVAEVLESLTGLAQRTGAVRVRTGPRDEALREARICYDHMAGEQGVALLSGLFENELLIAGEPPNVADRETDVRCHGCLLGTCPARPRAKDFLGPMSCTDR